MRDAGWFRHGSKGLVGASSTPERSTRRGVFAPVSLSAVLLSFGLTGLIGATPASADTGPAATNLGTLGGGTSQANMITDNGLIVGGATIDDNGDGHAVVWGAGHHLTDLGTLGGTTSSAGGANNAGQVVGVADLAGDSVRHAFVWTKAAGMTDLGSLGTSSSANGINDAGQIIGTNYSSDDNYIHGFVKEPGGGMVPIASLQGGGAIPYAQNASGQVVGPDNQPPYGITSQAFIWTAAGGTQDLGTLGGNSSIALDINDQGLVVGDSTTSTGNTDCFAWSESIGHLVDLGTLGGSSCVAQAVNNNGLIVGYSRTADGTFHAFTATVTGGLSELPDLGGYFASASAVNDSGQVIGYAMTPDNAAHAISWTAGGDLIDLNPSAGQYSSGARGINSSGQVVGYAQSADQDPNSGYYPTFATLWTVVPEPPTITSAASTSTGMRASFDFTVTTTGAPAPALTESGTLPAGVTFKDNGDGTGDLSGAAAAGNGRELSDHFHGNEQRRHRQPVVHAHRHQCAISTSHHERRQRHGDLRRSLQLYREHHRLPGAEADQERRPAGRCHLRR